MLTRATDGSVFRENAQIEGAQGSEATGEETVLSEAFGIRDGKTEKAAPHTELRQRVPRKLILSFILAPFVRPTPLSLPSFSNRSNF